MPRRTIINWDLSSFFGWGIYGLNLALHWARDPDLAPVGGQPIDENQIAVDALRRLWLMPFFERSADFQAGVGRGVHRPGDFVDLCSLNNEMESRPDAVPGARRIAVVFFESELDAEAVARARAYPLIVTGSRWNERVLRAYGLPAAATVLQGIDPTLFHPGPRAGLFDDRFLIFSGGKAETRKGQDLVLAAFKRFSAKRPDAMLATAWHSPWPELARSLDESRLVAPVRFGYGGRVDARAWAAASGIDPAKVIDLGILPNMLLPGVLREMDVALFPNRAEGGTNLVAMECMACGVPTILSNNTGHRDLVADGAGYVLERQTPTPWGFTGVGEVEGWGDSDVDEIVEALERAYIDRADARRRGVEGAKLLSGLTWAETARRMKDMILTSS